VAVENDYTLLVQHLTWLHESITHLHEEVQGCLLEEKRKSLEPNETHWVEALVAHLSVIEGSAFQLRDGADRVWRSRPGMAVFEDRPPPAPDTLLP
jgi:hypothetical protein